MDPEEERAQELELLQSMYPDEMTVLSPTVFTISIRLEPPTSSNGGTLKSSNQSLLVRVEYTANYPETAPVIELNLEQGVVEKDDAEDGNDGKTFEELIVLDSSDLGTLNEKARQEAEENLGFPSVFAIMSSLKDQAESILQEKQAEREREREAKIREEEEKEQAKFRGTLVNRENFFEWRRKFKAEMSLVNKDGKDEETKKRPTGREIFEKGLDGSRHSDEDDDESLQQGVKNVSIS
ncbi:RWD domain-containing protein [Lipomyces chichibuensis]|uniref:RWD domain-containing protein n=1 Tax=Lipomyces chichibuensis TaxID=1546026 RepID=UPI00334368CE